MIDPGPSTSLVIYTSFSTWHPDGEWHDRVLIGNGKLVIESESKEITWFTEETLYIGILSMRNQAIEIGYYFLNDWMVSF